MPICLRLFALFMQCLEAHPREGNLHRQCCLGMLKLSSSSASISGSTSTAVLCNASQLVNLWLNLMHNAMETFHQSDPYIVWLYVSILLNLLKETDSVKHILFVHPKATLIYLNAVRFVGPASGMSIENSNLALSKSRSMADLRGPGGPNRSNDKLGLSGPTVAATNRNSAGTNSNNRNSNSNFVTRNYSVNFLSDGSAADFASGGTGPEAFKTDIPWVPRESGHIEVLRQNVKELVEIFRSGRQLMRKLIIMEKKKEKLSG